MKPATTTARIAVPVTRDAGLDSPISAHFGRAPGFLTVDADGTDPHYHRSEHLRQASECAPISALAAQGVRIIVAQSMGRGALARCHEMGMRIHHSKAATVAQLLQDFRQGRCPDFPDESLCNHTDHELCEDHFD